MSETRKRVAVVFGGRSTEHEISKASAATVLSNMREDKYDVYPVYITKEGAWLLYENPIDNPQNAQWERYGIPCVISPDATHKGLLRVLGDKARRVPVDAVFPVLHGKNGEDGTVQGLCELAGLPYVGCNVLASAICMDKAYTKIIVNQLGIRQAPHVTINSRDILADARAAAEAVRGSLKGTVFVKPAAGGSSVGITKARAHKDLVNGLTLAAGHGERVVVEKAVKGRELECAVLGGAEPEASGVGEVIAAGEFYDYDAKYNNADSKTIPNADITPEAAAEVREAAVAVFKAVGGHGMARVDFFLEEGRGKPRVVFNEINTVPGFTNISMYSMLWAAKGMDTARLIDRLVELAFER